MNYYPSGFNGERADPISGHYHLGNGYRAYSPVLMRFTCPDSWSPFGAGGVNPYAYCEGDPINRADPSGHMSGSAIAGIVTGAIGIVLGIVSLLSAPVTGGSSIAAWMSTMATVTGLVSDALGIAGAALEERNLAAAAKLGWASLALGVAAMSAGLASGRMAKPRAKTPTVAAESMDGYAAKQVARYDGVATKMFRNGRSGRLLGGEPGDIITKDHRLKMHMDLRRYNGRNIYIHYTSSEGFKSITENKIISSCANLTRRGSKAKKGVYLALAKDAMNNDDAHMNLFLGQAKYENSATHAFIFCFNDLRISSSLTPKLVTSGGWASEVIYPDAIRFKDIQILFGGQNPFQ